MKLPDPDSRPPLVLLMDEMLRFSGRMKNVFAEVRRNVELGESELMVLSAVVDARRPPTASRIGRSLGQPRQIIQRAANALIDAGLLGTEPNPDHKRAVLLVPTEAGTALKRRADRLADTIAQSLSDGIDPEAMIAAANALHGFRGQIEAHLRKAGE